MTSDPLEPDQLHRAGLVVGNLQREFLVYRPLSFESAGAVVLAFHGAGSSAAEMVDFCGMNQTAAQHGFAVVYPDGTGRDAKTRSWNASGANVYAARHNTDDQGFIHRLLDWLLPRLPYDPSRVYATGMSNGGLFCYQLAREMPRRLAAMAPVAAALTTVPDRDQRDLASLPVPLVHIHGTDDHFVPYAGGLGHQSLTRTRFAPVEQTVRYWARRNGCDPTPQVTDLPTVVEDGTRVRRHRYAGAAEVLLYQVFGGGHTWPGQVCPHGFLGRVSGNLMANETIWDFFRTKVR